MMFCLKMSNIFLKSIIHGWDVLWLSTVNRKCKSCLRIFVQESCRTTQGHHLRDWLYMTTPWVWWQIKDVSHIGVPPCILHSLFNKMIQNGLNWILTKTLKLSELSHLLLPFHWNNFSSSFSHDVAPDSLGCCCENKYPPVLGSFGNYLLLRRINFFHLRLCCPDPGKY